MLAMLQVQWRANPVRGAALLAAVVVFVAAKFGVVLDQASVLQAVATIVPLLLAGEVARKHVVPIHKLVSDPKALPPDEVSKPC